MKKFGSWKGVFSYLRSHPEREWHGAFLPSKSDQFTWMPPTTQPEEVLTPTLRSLFALLSIFAGRNSGHGKESSVISVHIPKGDQLTWIPSTTQLEEVLTPTLLAVAHQTLAKMRGFSNCNKGDSSSSHPPTIRSGPREGSSVVKKKWKEFGDEQPVWKRKRSEMDELKSKPICSICEKEFGAWKGVFGHLCSHPEREWRDAFPQPKTDQLTCIPPSTQLEEVLGPTLLARQSPFSPPPQPTSFDLNATLSPENEDKAKDGDD
ncbi:uncharacterized protein [Euphorbia lathyris]|uniref:uncharacterized protein n=1 Tax=Euphorbia lathyris TaxID=212925 RepID=UPI003313C850